MLVSQLPSKLSSNLNKITFVAGSDGNRLKNLDRLIVEIHDRLIDFERLYITKSNSNS